MEASTRTVLRCVALLSILVLSLALAQTPAPKPAPQDSLVFPNTKTSTCAKKCGLTCILALEVPPNYVACFGLCMIACKIKPTSNSIDVSHGCTHNCVISVNKVMTPVANASISDLSSYAQGYIDSCSYSCSKNNKHF